MDSVLDFLFLRRLRFEYTSPPICPITPASGSSFGVTWQVISPILAMGAPNVNGRFLTWPCGEGEICFNMYFVNGGLLTEVATCIQPNTVLVCSAGCWQASAVVNGTEGPLTASICTDGTRPVEIPLPAGPGVQQYRLYKDSVLVLQSTFCAAYETCTLGCYSVTAITGDGETPPSPTACNGGDPTISITAPTNGTTLDLPSSTPFTATVYLNGHLANKVDFYSNSILIGTVTGSGPYSITWTPTTPGNYTLEAVLTYDGALHVTSAPVDVTVEVVLPALSDLIQWTESQDLDAQPDGTLLNTWLDKSGQNNHWTTSPGQQPVLDGVRTLNGHKTIRFNGSSGTIFVASKFIPNYGSPAGMELMVIFKNDSEAGVSGVINYQLKTNEAGIVAVGSMYPANFCSNDWMETFCVNPPPNSFGWHGCSWFCDIGNPGVNATTNWGCYNVNTDIAPGNLSCTWNKINFHTESGLPMLTNGEETFYTCGWSPNSDGSAQFITGNIAGVYLWKRKLTSAERAKALFYIQNWTGISLT